MGTPEIRRAPTTPVTREELPVDGHEEESNGSDRANPGRPIGQHPWGMRCSRLELREEGCASGRRAYSGFRLYVDRAEERDRVSKDRRDSRRESTKNVCAADDGERDFGVVGGNDGADREEAGESALSIAARIGTATERPIRGCVRGRPGDPRRTLTEPF